MKVFIVQGCHWMVPGQRMTAHKTAESAADDALSLVNIMLSDLELPPEASSWEDGLERVRKKLAEMDLVETEADDQADVWITELPLMG